MLVSRFMSQREFVLMMNGESLDSASDLHIHPKPEENSYIFMKDVNQDQKGKKYKPNDMLQFIKTDYFPDVLVEFETESTDLESASQTFDQDGKITSFDLLKCDSYTRHDFHPVRYSHVDRKNEYPNGYIPDWNDVSDYSKDEAFRFEVMFYEFEKSHLKLNAPEIKISHDILSQMDKIAQYKKLRDIQSISEQLGYKRKVFSKEKE